MKDSESIHNVLLVGGTGEIGRRVAHLLSDSHNHTCIHSLVRKPPTAAPTNSIHYYPTDFSLLPEHSLTEPIDTFICCLGTTIKTAGNAKAFYTVDHDYAVAAAELAKQCGASKFIIISSVGANAASANLYLKTKGEMERDIREITKAQATYFLRPSLLTGPRKEFRLGERLGGIASRILNPLLVGPLAKYKSIPLDTVANAICQLAQQSAPTDLPGALHGEQIRSLAKRHAVRNQLD